MNLTLVFHLFSLALEGKLNVSDEELDAMLAEGKGPINFTVFLALFGEKLNGMKKTKQKKIILY